MKRQAAFLMPKDLKMVYYLYNKGNKMKERESEIKRKGKGMKRQAAFLMFKDRR